MNDFQLYLAIGVPTIAVLASLTVSLVQIMTIKGDIRDLRADMRADMKDLRLEVQAEVREIRNDIKIIVSKLIELEHRVS